VQIDGGWWVESGARAAVIVTGVAIVALGVSMLLRPSFWIAVASSIRLGVEPSAGGSASRFRLLGGLVGLGGIGLIVLGLVS
jgi:hypothetical protein